VAELTAEDLDLLRQEGCLVDGSASFARRWDDPSAARLAADVALRTNRAVPGEPSLDLLMAAIERRGWGYRLCDGGACHRAWIYVLGHEAAQVDWGMPAAALALAFVAAARAVRAEEKTG
jgi:hypothetical protein